MAGWPSLPFDFFTFRKVLFPPPFIPDPVSDMKRAIPALSTPSFLPAIPLCLFLFGVPAQSRAADIVALCIGNDAYVRAEDVLDTPVADATLMKLALEALPGGADVVLLTDASRADIVIEPPQSR